MKQHLLTLGGGCAGIALTIMLLSFGSATIRGRESAATSDFVLETPDMADLGETDDAGLDEDNAADLSDGEALAVRSIEPLQFGLPEEVLTAPLERIEPRPPLSEPTAKEVKPVTTVLRNPVAVSAGLIRFGDRLLQLEGIEPQDAARVCDSGGKSWPCGMVARTALRNFLRARALVCRVPEGRWTGTVISTCTVAGLDPAAWLVESGWATVPDGSPLSDKAAVAAEARLGFSGSDPRGTIPAIAKEDLNDGITTESALPDL
ncbi:thermonuclease family protein [Rhizobium sp. 32-5/1]|uniref:thermonuclease family protein n=1 Tax=Rhizobium sp. 32-5/1 TaxID=3019602 RepID=UPI00240D2029|nr:thermonuclease family protein [Rhizobium sp. 32-5/1]WEZ84556.1 thermonuclease family protein [Rhizobium sp. 32-5/1]